MYGMHGMAFCVIGSIRVGEICSISWYNMQCVLILLKNVLDWTWEY